MRKIIAARAVYLPNVVNLIRVFDRGSLAFLPSRLKRPMSDAIGQESKVWISFCSTTCINVERPNPMLVIPPPHIQEIFSPHSNISDGRYFLGWIIWHGDSLGGVSLCNPMACFLPPPISKWGWRRCRSSGPRPGMAQDSVWTISKYTLRYHLRVSNIING